MTITWTSSATETRGCFPYRSLDDLGSTPDVEWEWRHRPEDEWSRLEEGRLVPPHRGRAPTRIRARLLLPGDVSEQIREHLPGIDLGLGLLAQSSATRDRRAVWGRFETGTELEIEFEPDRWRGSVELKVLGFVGVEPNGGGGVADLPDHRGAPVWWSAKLHLVLDEGAAPPGKGFDVVWKDDLPDGQLYRLEPRSGGDTSLAPQLQLNGTDARIADVWNSTGTVGTKARLRDLLNAMVATEVMTDLAVIADEVDESTDPEEDVQLKKQIQGALEKRFKIPRLSLEGVSTHPGPRRDLLGRLQGSRPVKLFDRIRKLVDEVDR